MIEASAKRVEFPSLKRIGLNVDYRTGENDLVADFYGPCLQAATKYDRAAGFFGSSIFVAAGQFLLDFAKRSGRVRLVCSPRLTDEDIEAIDRGYRMREEAAANSLCDEIDRLVESPHTRQQTIMLATLIAVGAIEVKIAFRPAHLRMYHEKLGIFRDAWGNVVSFRGSSNETWSAWHGAGNYESFDVFRSWADSTENLRTCRHSAYFEDLWMGRVRDVEITPFPEVALTRLRAVATPSLDEIHVPAMRVRRSLQEHQIKAIEQWRQNGKRGVLQHATGSGKTVTALAALSEHLDGGLPAIVLVPSYLLLQQWREEIESQIDDTTILPCDGTHDGWRQDNRVEGFTAYCRDLGKRVLLATLQTASKPEFINRVQGGDHLLVICDEVHRAGSREHSQIFAISSGSRLGLSATPSRFGDPTGSAAITQYFGPILKPPFTLADAIRVGRLVPYEYYPIAIHLSAVQALEWNVQTERIQREIAKECGDGPLSLTVLSTRTKLLLIQRARIAKKAEVKIPTAVTLLQKHYRPGESWLVYCEDIDQLTRLRRAVANRGLPVDEYHTEMIGDREATLRWFRQYGGILVAVRCLDEGVDIPSASHALILASSKNPREFIQRRGRVLRSDNQNPLKRFAVIYDMLVVPEGTDSEQNQISLTKSEIARGLEFAHTAMNRSAETTLLGIAVSLGFDPDSVQAVGMEDEDEVEKE